MQNEVIVAPSQQLATISNEKFLEVYSPNNCLMHSTGIKGVSDALSRQTLSLVQIKKSKGEAFLRSYISLWLIYLNELLNLNKPLTEAQIRLCAEQIMADYHHLKISELSLIFKRIGECGELYERISMPKVMSIFRQYDQERTEVVVTQNQQAHEQFRYRENRTESYDDDLERLCKKMRKF